ncbi:MAG TPA: hypothetical protein VF631_02715 [Allosphingosinicella sp.]|jgi:hypothetical protein|uniref:hypothetical protein n=1 Tax=Allosphingosinicella sp. TaxID=2823234 RepID=UPI002F285C61
MSDDQQPTPETKQAGQRNADPKRKKQLLTAGVAAGIGSAAVVAALLYAKSARRNQD